jgi:DNA-binding NarL/FixJ family response regulator
MRLAPLSPFTYHVLRGQSYLRNKNLSKRLLIVDDEPNLLRAVAACLSAEGYEVDTARSGEDALLRVAQSVPDLIVSDVRMPRMDGYALSRQLRSNPRTDLIPIIFLTAKDESADRIAGIRSGVDAYLTKPFEPTELLAVIENILRRVERTHAEIARLVSANARQTIEFTDEDLTEAEERVAASVALGMSNKEIAANFEISVRTVENHISHILAKKNFDNRVEIARYVLARQS